MLIKVIKNRKLQFFWGGGGYPHYDILKTYAESKQRFSI